MSSERCHRYIQQWQQESHQHGKTYSSEGLDEKTVMTLQEINVAKYIWNNQKRMVYERENKLGEAKDLSKEEDCKNIKSKKRRKICSYNVYSFDFDGKTWFIKLERHKKGGE